MLREYIITRQEHKGTWELREKSTTLNFLLFQAFISRGYLELLKMFQQGTRGKKTHKIWCLPYLGTIVDILFILNWDPLIQAKMKPISIMPTPHWLSFFFPLVFLGHCSTNFWTAVFYEQLSVILISIRTHFSGCFQEFNIYFQF